MSFKKVTQLNFTDKTLLEKMKITQIEISDRLNILGLKKQNFEILFENKHLIENNINFIIEEFYLKQTQNDEIAQLIGDLDTLKKLKSAQHGYILELFSGCYDQNYVNNRLRIGMVHKRIGVDPKLYMTAMSDLKYILNRELKKSSDNVVLLIESLDKLLTFDSSLVIDTYIDSLLNDVLTSKNKLEVYAKNLEEKSSELERLTQLDSMTHLFNRRSMEKFLTRELKVAKRRNTNLALAYFDIDNFKKINDKEGHNKGDQVILYFSNLLLNNVREVDIPCRAGGDEFCLILPECNQTNAEVICNKILTTFTKKYPKYRISVGISQTDQEYTNNQYDLINIADQNMYKNKLNKKPS